MIRADENMPEMTDDELVEWQERMVWREYEADTNDAEAACHHPPTRLYAGTARDDTKPSGEVFWTGCLDCGAILTPTVANECVEGSEDGD